ncbi:mannosyltransferase putative-domain-containing protein [Umbelopsis sp. PMI_123]|nr:mannosyltransferase putative-domain-containing protein [Umbelopsis sp. PMI_123]
MYKVLFQMFDPMVAAGVDVQSSHPQLWHLFQSLERLLYPWIHMTFETAFEIPPSSKGAGIVFCVGNNQFRYAVTAIRALREILQSQLPIEIFFIDDNDLSPMKRLYFESEFTNVKTRDISKIIDNKWAVLGGWAIKPYAILASSFTEVIMMDADVYFFRKPEELLHDPAYLKTGALFFYDRTLFPKWFKGRDWLLSFLPSYSTQFPRSRWWSLSSSHEQEAGVVVINKSKSLLGLLSTCKMNGKKERDEVTYKHVHGDKETFWVGYEMTQTPYAFIKSYGAVIGGLGHKGDPSQVCGNQLHLGTDGRPLWWNGGMFRDKNKYPDEYLQFTHYAMGQDWEFQTSCIIETDHIYQTTPEEQHLGERYIQLDAQRKHDEARIEDGSWKQLQ